MRIVKRSGGRGVYLCTWRGGAQHGGVAAVGRWWWGRDGVVGERAKMRLNRSILHPLGISSAIPRARNMYKDQQWELKVEGEKKEAAAEHAAAKETEEQEQEQEQEEILIKEDNEEDEENFSPRLPPAKHAKRSEVAAFSPEEYELESEDLLPNFKTSVKKAAKKAKERTYSRSSYDSSFLAPDDDFQVRNCCVVGGDLYILFAFKSQFSADIVINCHMYRTYSNIT